MDVLTGIKTLWRPFRPALTDFISPCDDGTGGGRRDWIAQMNLPAKPGKDR